MTTTDTTRAQSQARAQLEAIVEMMDQLENGNEEAQENAREQIDEDPLSVEVRSEWVSPGGETELVEYRILLCTGGPAVRITGDLGRFNEPDSAQLEYQDWFTPWERYRETTDDEDAALLRYARQFYFKA